MQSFRKASSWQVAGITVVWACSLFGILQVQYLPIQSLHSICGPWGCGPALPPLIAYHGFWVVLVSYPTMLACRGLDAEKLRRLGWIVTVIGCLGLFIAGVWDMIPALLNWLPRINSMPAKYIVHRYLLAVVTLVDIPVVQITLAGITCFMTARARKRGHVQNCTNDESAVVFDDVSSPVEKVRLVPPVDNRWPYR